jgi:hypothetical protein
MEVRALPSTSGRRTRLAFSGILTLLATLSTLTSCESEYGEQLGPGDTPPSPGAPLPGSPSAVQLVLARPGGTIEVDQQIRLAAEGRSSTGEPVQVAVQWHATGGSIAPDGTFSAAAPGTYTVFVKGGTGGKLRDSTTVRVSPSNVKGLKVKPGSVWLAPLAKQVFTATARLKDGSTVQLAARWSASGGTIDSGGLYQAPDVAGSYQVVATSVKGIADTAIVTVAAVDSGATVERIVLKPASVSIKAYESQAFSAAALLSNSETTPVAVSYRVTGGTITPEGLYTAGDAPGSYHVIAAAADGKSDTSAVTITRDSLSVEQVVLTPATISLTSGSTQQFLATARLSDGSTAPVAVTYNVTGGTVTDAGLYTAGTTVGSYRVIAAAAGGKADTSAVTITAATGTLSAIVLTPTPVSLITGARQQFSVAGKLSDGTSVSDVPVTYTATGGTITGEGQYTAGQTAGSYRVIARHQDGSLADTAAVTIIVSSPGTGVPARMADSLVDAIGFNAHVERDGYGRVWQSIIIPRVIELGARHARGGDPNALRSATVARMQDLYDATKAAWGTTHGVRWLKSCAPTVNFTDASHCINVANSGGTQLVELLTGQNEMDLVQNGGGTGWQTNWVQWTTAVFNMYNSSGTWQNVPFVMSSVSKPGAQSSLGYHAGIMKVCDMHSYPGGEMPSNVSQNWIPAANAVCGASKPRVATETGYHNAIQHTGSHYPISERGSGKYYSRLPFEYFNRGVMRFYAYQLWEVGTDADMDKREPHFGLLRRDGSRKPQFIALANIIAVLKDPGPAFIPGKLEYTLTGALGTTHNTLLQKRDGRFYLALWQEISVWDRNSKRDLTNVDDVVTLTLGVPARAIKVYRPGEGSSPVQTGSGSSIELSVPDEVLIVEVTQ